MLKLNYAQWNEIIQRRSENCGGGGKHWIEFSNGFSQIFPDDKLVCLRFDSFCILATLHCMFPSFFHFPFSSVFEVHSSMFGLKFEFVSPWKKYLYRLERNICIASEERKYFIDLHSGLRLAANLGIFA